MVGWGNYVAVALAAVVVVMTSSSISSSSSRNSKDEEIATTAIAIDKDRNSEFAVRWAVDNLLKKSSNVILVHVKTQSVQSKEDVPKGGRAPVDSEKEFFLPYRGFCARKGVRAKEVVLHDIDVSNALVDFISTHSITNLVLGASNRSALTRAFRNVDVPTTVSKSAPDFCSVYVASKGKVQNAKTASQPSTPTSATGSKRSSQPRFSVETSRSDDLYRSSSQSSWRSGGSERISLDRSSDSMQLTPRDLTPHDLTPRDRIPRSIMASPSNVASPKHPSSNLNPRVRNEGIYSHLDSNMEISDFSGPPSFQSIDLSSENLDRPRTSDVSRSSVSSSQASGKEIDQWKTEETRKLQAATQAQDAALALAEMEKQKTRVALEAAKTSRRLAELEVQKRKNAEMKAMHEAEERKKAMEALARTEIRYRKYTIEEIEIATEYFSSSLKIEVLSYMRHPHMVLLLGACPEYGCIVYEYMENGSLEDRLFRRNNTPPLPWRTRFKIAAEIAAAVLFLHQTKPEPLVHRDLKPANILLGRHFVSKISDVGLARLVPPNVADNVTQYQMTAAAGTFCYIDPEYQQTGMLGVKSDIYSLGIMLLQIITAKPPMGLTHHVGRAIEKGTFSEMLDPTVTDWPFEEAMSFAKLSIQCCELRRKDRPDLASVILPELQRLSDLGSDNGSNNRGAITYGSSFVNSNFQVRSPFSQEKRRRNPGTPTETQGRSVLKESSSTYTPELESEVSRPDLDKAS
ncbi:hypothetical protein RHMOL_Rhmol08G0311700 [Rhododendron molle]|uniref:Uncharacterized protein n=1 Tax=Rhododendron molle TaxID=49168 RepID=A0ACC0MUB9_RHOML|nr:hypothetical protein RHMOL_Rhmol08G0311700 [Rhododendron molle]